MHDFKPIHLVTVPSSSSSSVKHIYLDNETFLHRRALFDDNLGGLVDVRTHMFKRFDNNINNQIIIKTLNVLAKEDSALEGCGVVVNSSLEAASSLRLAKNSIVVDSRFKACKLTVGPNTYLSDLILVCLFILFLYRKND